MLPGLRRGVIPKMTQACQECGCTCTSCLSTNSLDLHHEIEDLRAKLKRSQARMGQMERDYCHSRDYAEQEISKLQDELAKLRDRYDRLFESHKKMQRVNHNLEDKLLTVVNKFETEKLALQKDVANITTKLVDAKVSISDLEEENERFRNDCNIAVKLLQCKPSNFVAHKLNTLPLDLQERVKSHLSRQQLMELEDGPPNEAVETKMIRVPMPTFPPTAMVYSINKVNQTNGATEPHVPTVPTTLIAKVLTQAEARVKPRRIYICHKCHSDVIVLHKETQTSMTYSDTNGLHGQGLRTAHTLGHTYPGVHRPRLNSTETEI